MLFRSGAVDISAVHTLNKFSADNTNKINTEFLGLDWILNSSKVKEGADSLRDFVRSFNQAAQEAAGDNIQAEDEGGAENVGQAPAWNDYFDLGATMTVASSANVKRSFLSGFVRNYFENSYKEMVSFFAKDQKISANDLKDIIDIG